MFEVWLCQIIEPDPERRFGFGVRLRSELEPWVVNRTFFKVKNFELEDIFA